MVAGTLRQDQTTMSTKISQSAYGAVEDVRYSGIAFADISDFGLSLESIVKEWRHISHRRFFQRSPEIEPTKPNILRYENFYWSLPWRPITKFIHHQWWKAVASDYFQRKAVTNGFRLWRTIPFSGELCGSQQWHRDEQKGHVQPRPIFKVFLNLNEINTANGPLQYLLGTHSQGADSSVLRPGERLTDQEVFNALPRIRKTSNIGRAGLLTFADTSGIHCGGRCLTGYRDTLMVQFR